jgi:hypothetical protein
MDGRGASGGENKQEGETVVKQQQALYCHASQVLKSAFYNFPSPSTTIDGLMLLWVVQALSHSLTLSYGTTIIGKTWH